ncbi:hypothetical protein C8F04DRAFT_904509, partial [Mycena alexandri]
MAGMARDYHDKLQSERMGVRQRDREDTMKKVLDRIETKVTPEQYHALKSRLTLDDVRDALRRSVDSKAPGMDSITYEVWKILDQRYESYRKIGKPAFNILGAMHQVYNDIEKYGMVQGTGFS